MRTNDGRIDHLQGSVAQSASSERLKDHIPDAAVGPPPKLPKDRVPIAEFLRQVAPRCAGSHQPEHRVEHATMVARRSAATTDQKRSKYAHSSSVISPRIKAALPAALNQFTFPASTDLSTRPRCLIPGFDGAPLSPDSKDALWDRFFTAAPQRQRRSVERYSIVKRA